MLFVSEYYTLKSNNPYECNTPCESNDPFALQKMKVTTCYYSAHMVVILPKIPPPLTEQSLYNIVYGHVYILVNQRGNQIHIKDSLVCNGCINPLNSQTVDALPSLCSGREKAMQAPYSL